MSDAFVGFKDRNIRSFCVNKNRTAYTVRIGVLLASKVNRKENNRNNN